MADRLRFVLYTAGDLEEREDLGLDDAITRMKDKGVGWLVVDGPTEADYAVLESRLDLHPLALEDCRNTRQRPKVEEFSSNTYIVMRSVRRTEEGRLVTEQVNLFLGPEWVLVVGERPGGLFDPVRDRLRRGRARLRGSGAEYLTYALLDAVVDTVQPAVEATGRRLEAIEDAVFRQVDKAQLEEIQDLKHDLRRLHREVGLMRDALSRMLRDEDVGFSEETWPYLRDVMDHTGQGLDKIDAQSESAAHLMDLYLTMVSNKTNDIMKFLTLVATIFIPLSFLAGVYGMNFDTSEGFNMPELAWGYGYLMFWVVALLVGGGFLWMFKRRGWL